jgi:threonine/homoserine/homoserine lactone efflux protein
MDADPRLLLDAFGRGLLLGVSIAAPVGPIGLLCIQRTLRAGRAAGLATGLGAATADACYGLLGATGASGLAQALAGSQRWLGLAGAAWLAWMGLRSLRMAGTAGPATPGPAAAPDAPPRSGLRGAWASAFGLTLTNPMTILFFAATFTGLGLPPGLGGAGWLVLGVFAGSAAWWLLLSGVVAHAGHQLGARALRGIDRASGILLLGFAAWALWRSLR